MAFFLYGELWTNQVQPEKDAYKGNPFIALFYKFDHVEKTCTIQLVFQVLNLREWRAFFFSTRGSLLIALITFQRGTNSWPSFIDLIIVVFINELLTLILSCFMEFLWTVVFCDSRIYSRQSQRNHGKESIPLIILEELKIWPMGTNATFVFCWMIEMDLAWN